MNHPVKIFLTGSKGAGKSSIIRAILAEFHGRAGGFYTQRLLARDLVVGYEFCAIHGDRRCFASIYPNGHAKQGRYFVDVEVFDTLGVHTLLEARQQAELIVMDELGRMEANAKRFREAVESCLDAKTPICGVVQRQSPFFEMIRRRGIPILEVNPRNRQLLVDELSTVRFDHADAVERIADFMCPADANFLPAPFSR